MSCLLPLDGPDPMTDARYPERWLNDTRILLLSDKAHRLFVTGMAWSVSNRSDGVLTDDDLSLMRRVDTTSVDDLVSAGLWRRDGKGYRITEFDATQTSAKELERAEHARKVDRTRKAESRSRTRPSDASSVTPQDRKDSARTGDARTGKAGREVGTPTQRPLRADAYDD